MTYRTAPQAAAIIPVMNRRLKPRNSSQMKPLSHRDGGASSRPSRRTAGSSSARPGDDRIGGGHDASAGPMRRASARRYQPVIRSTLFHFDKSLDPADIVLAMERRNFWGHGRGHPGKPSTVEPRNLAIFWPNHGRRRTHHGVFQDIADLSRSAGGISAPQVPA